MLVTLDHLIEGDLNTRTVPISEIAESGLKRSIAVSGVLQAILVRPNGEPDKYEIVLGRRRVRAARAAGLAEIEAIVRPMTDAEVRQAQVVENVVRENMHPTDQWRAVRELMMDGLDVTTAANALGLDDRSVRRMEHLGRLPPLVLKMAEIQMPTDVQLRAIANAPLKQQQAASKIKNAIFQQGAHETVDWREIVNACRISRISRGVAIFDPTTTKIAWDEDLFAQPDAEDQFTTTEIDKFMTAQRAALEAQVAALVKDKKRVRLTRISDHGSMELPKGFRCVYDSTLEKMRRGETAFQAIGPDGAIMTQIAVETPVQTRKTSAKGSATPEADDDEVVTEVIDVKSPLTKAGQGMVAVAKTDAIRKALLTPMTASNVIALLVLTLCADNVEISTDGPGHGRFDDLILKLIDPTGNPMTMKDKDMIMIGQQMVSRVLQVRGPDAPRGTGSGPAAEWIGHIIDAQAKLGRFDTPAFLETMNSAELRKAAEMSKVKDPGNVKALRGALVGKAAKYRPAAAVFGAPAPKAR